MTSPEERRRQLVAAICDALYANLFDGQRGGRVTTDLATLVADAAEDVVWGIEHHFAENEPELANAIRFGLRQPTVCRSYDVRLGGPAALYQHAGAYHHATVLPDDELHPDHMTRIGEVYVIDYPDGHPQA